MMSAEIEIEGMECDACAGHVTRAVRAVPGVGGVRVSLDDRRASVEFDPGASTLEEIYAAIREEGYDVVE